MVKQSKRATRRLLLCASFVLLVTNSVSAQVSPPASTKVTLGGKAISVRYSAPSVRGRRGQIFGTGGLVSRDPTYPAWRAGANSATSFRTDADLDIDGLAVPEGDYTL